MLQRKILLQSLSLGNALLMTLLAVWQIQRAHTKYLMINLTPPAAINEQQINNKISDQHPVHYHYPINTKTYFIVEPAIHQHQVGVELIALSEITHLQQTLAINFGWFRNPEHAAKALIKLSQKSIEGILVSPKGKLLRQPVNTAQKWPKKLSYIDLKYIENLTQKKMYPKILLTPNTNLYQTIASADQLKLGITRHICYALQFVAFAIVGRLLSQKLQREHDEA